MEVVSRAGCANCLDIIKPSPRHLQLLFAATIATPFRIQPGPCKLGVPPSTVQIGQRRHAHTRRHVSSTAVNLPGESTLSQPASKIPRSAALSCLPLSTLIRSYLITAISSYPILLRPSLSALSFLAHSKSPLLNPDTSPILRYALKHTFYAQFCAGETPAEVQKSLAALKSMGYSGVILGHAKEVVLEGDDAAKLEKSRDCKEQDRCNAEDVAKWEKSTLDTILLAKEGDFVALKFTGAGRQALQNLSTSVACSPALEAAVHKICRLSEQRGVRLLFDAEQARLQEGIDNWTLYFMKIYNKGEKALVYGTYQAYAKKTPRVLARHMEEANKHAFVLGVKLVRGAYLGSDPRELFWPTVEDTHNCYNSIAASLIKREYGNVLKPMEGGSGQFPKVNFILASHNAKSVTLACQLRDEQARNGEPRIEMAYGQLMGMADNVSCNIVKSAMERSQLEDKSNVDIPKPYKYLVWGKIGECLKYLLRRAQENRDAVSRTTDARKALGSEILRRVGL
jgi:proline dehydrogenase